MFASGTIFRLKGSILTMSFLDCNGLLIPNVAHQWKEGTKTAGAVSGEDNRKDKTCNSEYIPLSFCINYRTITYENKNVMNYGERTL